jgi:hypothetical protein
MRFDHQLFSIEFLPILFRKEEAEKGGKEVRRIFSPAPLLLFSPAAFI